MARRSRSSTSGLGDLAKRLKDLSIEIPEAAQKALDDVADATIEGMVRPWDAAIEGGPVPFSKINPRSFRSAVIRGKSNSAVQRGEPTATVVVNKLQSAYLRYHLSDKDGKRARVREPGEVGIAEKRNFVPVDKNLQKYQGRGLTPEGNLHRSSLRKLFFRAMTLANRNKAQAERDRKRLEKLKGGGAVSDEELEAFRLEKKRRRVKRKPGAATDIFFGVPKGRKTNRRGFWQRPKSKDGKIQPLVHAEDRSDYSDRDQLQNAWNTGVLVGTRQLPGIMEDAVEDAIAKAGRK